MNLLCLFFICGIFLCFGPPGFGQVTKSEAEDAIKNTLNGHDHSCLSRSDFEAALRAEEIRRQFQRRERHRKEIASGFRLDILHSNYLLALSSELPPVDEKERRNSAKNGAEQEAQKEMESAIGKSFEVQPSMKLFGPVLLNGKQTFLWTGQAICPLPDGTPNTFLWIGYFEGDQWHHAIALWGDRMLKRNLSDMKQIIAFLLEKNFEEIADQWEHQFDIEKNRPWRYRSGVVVLGKAVGYQNGQLEVLEQATDKNDKPQRLWLTGLDDESQQAAFYYIWKYNLPLVTKTLSIKKHWTEKSPTKITVWTEMIDCQWRKNGKVGPKYNLSFRDMNQDIVIQWMPLQIWQKEFKKEQEYIAKYLDFINGER